MIKLINTGKTKFRITCSMCEAKYEYGINDLSSFENNASIKCPCCGCSNYHYQRDRWEEEDENE